MRVVAQTRKFYLEYTSSIALLSKDLSNLQFSLDRLDGDDDDDV